MVEILIRIELNIKFNLEKTDRFAIQILHVCKLHASGYLDFFILSQ